MMSANLRAFLFLVRWAEGTSDDNGYRALYGHLRERPKLFDGWADHPRQAFKTPWGWTSAAGAFQFMAKVEGKVQTDTWDRAKHALGLPDFSPESQNKAALWLIEKRGALPAVEAGDLEQALARCSWEWASLPAGPGKPGRYGQPTRSFESCLVIFERAGGTLLTQAPSPDDSVAVSATGDPAPAPLPQPARPPSATVETPPSPAPAAPTYFPSREDDPGLPPEPAMPLPAAAALSLAAELWRILRPTERVNQVAGAIEKAAPVLFDAARQAAPAAVNEQQMVEQIKANPQAQAQFRAAAMLRWDDLAPMLEFEAAQRREAREFADRMTGTGPVWRQIGYGVFVTVLALGIVFGGAFMLREIYMMQGTSEQTRGNIVGFLLAMIPVVVYWVFGSSRSSQIKDQTIAEQAKR